MKQIVQNILVSIHGEIKNHWDHVLPDFEATHLDRPGELGSIYARKPWRVYLNYVALIHISKGPQITETLAIFYDRLYPLAHSQILQAIGDGKTARYISTMNAIRLSAIEDLPAYLGIHKLFDTVIESMLK